MSSWSYLSLCANTHSIYILSPNFACNSIVPLITGYESLVTICSSKQASRKSPVLVIVNYFIQKSWGRFGPELRNCSLQLLPTFGWQRLRQSSGKSLRRHLWVGWCAGWLSSINQERIQERIHSRILRVLWREKKHQGKRTTRLLRIPWRVWTGRRDFPPDAAWTARYYQHATGYVAHELYQPLYRIDLQDLSLFQAYFASAGVWWAALSRIKMLQYAVKMTRQQRPTASQ